VSDRAPAAERPRRRHVGWPIAVAILLLSFGIGAVLKLTKSHHAKDSTTVTSVVTTWAAGARPAPAFTLTDEHGKSISLASLRGQTAIVTFIDPLCRDFCPREASVLTEAAAKLGPNPPAIVSVSVDPWADTAQNFRLDRAHWKLGPTWRWATGSFAELARVWQPYGVAVQVTKKTIAGVKVRYITHTGAAYLIDGKGYERALFLYPFTTDQVVSAAQALEAG
jgi:protein SCO1